jgi:hypothetical protein
MSLARRDRQQPARSLLPRCGGYVTDGHRLFRVVSQFAAVGDHAFASLEDCLTLEVRAYAALELREMGLRPVPAPSRPGELSTDAHEGLASRAQR